MLKFKNIFKKSVIFIVCIAILISAPIIMLRKTSIESQAANKITLNIWQIDSFEGGKGSRASYLQKIANRFSKDNDCYISVASLSSSAAKENIKLGTVPDLISYGAGIWGIENIIQSKNPYTTWCHGGYCFLTLDENADFNDISAANTVINCGTENMVSIAGLMCGINGAAYDSPTGAYVKLLNGKYKYLLGTQRDIYRLKTREVAFKIKPITEFNDLYQNISITSACSSIEYARKYVELLISSSDIADLGLMQVEKHIHTDEAMKQMEGIDYNFKLTSPISEQSKNEILNAIESADINLIKNLLK